MFKAILLFAATWMEFEGIMLSETQQISQSVSYVQLFATTWTIAHQAPLSMGFSRWETWSGLPFPPLGDPPNQEIESTSPALAGWFFTTVKLWNASDRERQILHDIHLYVSEFFEKRQTGRYKGRLLVPEVVVGGGWGMAKLVKVVQRYKLPVLR